MVKLPYTGSLIYVKDWLIGDSDSTSFDIIRDFVEKWLLKKNIRDEAYIVPYILKEYIVSYTVGSGRPPVDPKYERSFYHGEIKIY